MSGLRLNTLMLILIGILLFLQYKLWFQADGLRDMLKLKANLGKQKEETKLLKQQNEELLFQIQRLQHSQDAMETRARSELGMIKKGETFYQIVK